MSTHPNELGLVYVIGTYPLLTTTFIDREIKLLREWGIEVHVVAMRRPAADLPFSKDQRALQQGVTYLIPVNWWRLLLAHLHFALFHPRSFLQTLVYLLTRPHPDNRARVKTILHFGEGVYAAFLVRKLQFRELHAHFVDRAATVALVAGRLLGKPYSISLHAGADIFVSPILLREKIVEARHIVTCTLFNKAHVEALIGQNLGDKISYINHGLDLRKYEPSLTNLNGRVLILSVGQLVERKGFSQLIRACRSLKDNGYEFQCQIVGQGPQYQELEDLINRLSLEDTVELCGPLPHEKVIEKYSQASMFVLPCIQSKNGDVDGIPNVLPEAMAMQLPVISTTISAIPELLVDQGNAILVPPQDTDALVAAMAALLDKPALRMQLGTNGRQAILARFDVERNVRQLATTLWSNWFDLDHSLRQ